jgi:alcohol dehydrogenase (cytochrome c)
LTALISSIYRFDIRFLDGSQKEASMRRRTAAGIGRVAGGLLCMVSAVALAAGCSSAPPAPVTSTFAGAAKPAGSWPYPNGDLANTRDATGSRITAANVGTLREAWTFKLTGTAARGVSYAGSLAAAPVVVNGVVYLQDLYANVYAISLASGRQLWEYSVNAAEKSGPGPDGVAVANGVVYGDSSTTAFALNAATGKVVWNDASLLNGGQGAFEIQPQVSGGRVYLASAYGSGPGGGVLLALNAATGAVLWRFSTVAGGEPSGVAALGLGSGGAWETPLVGTDGSVTFGTGNPYQSIGQAVSHPARDLYTDSEVNLDAATGKLRWYYQAVPNDFKDWDMQLSPIAATVDGVPAVIGGGKMGIVYAMNAATGALLWQTPGRGAQRDRRRLGAAARAQAHHQAALHHRTGSARRRAHRHGASGRQRVRRHGQPAGEGDDHGLGQRQYAGRPVVR